MEAIFSMQASMILMVCLLILFLIFFKEKVKFIISFIKRGVCGCVLIAVLNAFFSYLSFSLFVGLNPFTIAICAFLGVPGALMLFVIPFL